ncbi:MAG TPA: hypothetical protein VGQ18_10730 [Gemmatimonadales bacterium]|nr:hypothetical protein [Gemmatimonadales bacterium]
MDHRLRWLLDLVATCGWVCWELVKHRHAQHARLRLVRVKRGLVAVLVSRMGMRDKARRALGDRTNLRFVRTWAELQDVVIREGPSTILADPRADLRGDPEWHIKMFAEAWGIPVVLYAEVTPELASVLLSQTFTGIRDVIFHRFDDNPARFQQVVTWERPLPPREPPHHPPHHPPLKAA